MRGFYSSLLQRNAQLKSIYGGGSMSTLVLMDEDNLAASASGVSDSSAHSSDAKKAQCYTLSDFERPYFTNKTSARMALLVEKGITITDKVSSLNSFIWL